MNTRTLADSVRAALLGRMSDVIAALLPDGTERGGEWCTWDHSALRFKVNVQDDGTTSLAVSLATCSIWCGCRLVATLPTR